MKLYDYTLKETLRGENLLIIIIDLGDNDLIFNNVDIYTQDLEEIEYFKNLMTAVDKGDKYAEKKLNQYLEEIYHDEIDPHSRGEN